MAMRAAAGRRPALVALALPVLAGLAYMAAFGAPRSYLAVNALALVAGGAWILFARIPAAATPRRVAALVLLALLALPLLTGPELDGVARWIPLGPVTFHAGMLALPPLAVLAAGDRAQGPPLLLAAVLASLLQPDSATALALACAATGIALAGRARPFGLIAVAALVAALAAAQRGDLPPQPFVEHVIGDAARQSLAFSAGLLATLAAAFALVVWSGLPGRAERFALAGTLLGFAVAAMIASYPTPLIGYGASAIVGLAIALGLRSKPAA